LVIKAVLKDEMRRFSLEQGSYASLLNNLASHFNINNVVSSVVVKYVDDEDDQITISSEQEFSEAVRLAHSRNNILKVFVTEKASASPAVASSFPSANVAIPLPVVVKNATSQACAGHGGWKKLKMQFKLRKQEKKAEKSLLQTRYQRAKETGDAQASERAISEIREWKKNWKAEKEALKRDLGEQWHAHKKGWSKARAAHSNGHGGWGHHHGHHHGHPHSFGHGGCGHNNMQQHHAGGDCPKFKAKLAGGRFVKHVSTPDGTEVNPGQLFDKIWRFRNESETAWPEGTKLLWVGGDRLGAPDFVLVPKSVKPSEEVDVSMILIAPTKSGRYTGYFRLHNGESKFGQRVWVQIVVSDSSGSEKDESVSVNDDDMVKYQHQLKVLSEMSFNDVKLNIRLLKKFKGDLQQVVQRLLKRNQKLAALQP